VRFSPVGNEVRDALLEKLRRSLLELDKGAAMEAVRAIVEGGATAAQEGVDALTEALAEVGRRFQDGEWYLGELVYSGEIAKQVMDLLGPRLSAGAGEGLGVIVVGTVRGDLHDLGKNIFISYARSSGFEIADLGTDVSPEQFAEAVRDHRPVALGLSCLLTVCAGGVGRVIEELASQGLRETSKVIVGGAALTEEFAREVGADAFAPDAVTGTQIVRGWSGS
jgi:5-methyltetrahydrofolate--homocysteine methyltransferase